MVFGPSDKNISLILNRGDLIPDNCVLKIFYKYSALKCIMQHVDFTQLQFNSHFFKSGFDVSATVLRVYWQNLLLTTSFIRISYYNNQQKIKGWCFPCTRSIFNFSSKPFFLIFFNTNTYTPILISGLIGSRKRWAGVHGQASDPGHAQPTAAERGPGSCGRTATCCWDARNGEWVSACMQ